MRLFGHSEIFHVTIWLIISAVFNVEAPAQPQTAQPVVETKSHRRLELPENGSSDQQQQMFLLKQLQAMLNGNDPTQQQESQSPRGSQWQQLKKMYEQFGGSLPPGMLPKPEDIPPELIERVKSDPRMRNQVQQMLEQFKRDGRIPQFNNGNGFQLPVPPRPSHTPPQKNGNRPLNGGANSEDSLPPDALKPSPNNTPSGTSDSTRRQDAMKQLEDMWNNAHGNRSQAGGAASGQSNPPRPRRDGTAQPGETHNSPQVPPPEDATGWDQLLDNLIKGQQGSDQVPPGSTRQSGNSPLSGGSSPPSLTNDRNDTSDRHRPGGGNSSARQTPSVAEFLEQMKDVVVPESFQFPERQDPTMENADRSKQQAADALQEKQREASESLQENGLKATLKKIVQDARQDVKRKASDASTAAAEQGGVSDSLARAIKGISKDIVEMVKNGDLKISLKPSTENEPGSSKSDEGQHEEPKSMLGEMTQSTGEFFSDLASTPKAPEEAIPPRSADATPTPAKSMPTMSVSEWLIPVLFLAFVAALLAWKSGWLDAGEIFAPGGRGVTTANIHTREDVVQAFHRMALKPKRSPRQAETWWTHQMVTEQIEQQSPEHTYQVRVLAELYEQARYQPEDRELTPEQIAEARAALKRCEER